MNSIREVKRHRDAMLRAHRMSCSDPSDPARTTTYGESAKAIDYLLSLLPECDETP